MAEQFVAAGEDELACPVCFHFYVPPHDPKHFPNCAHTCCRLCLIKMTEGGLKTIKCPQCNKVSTLPDEGVDDLMTILALRNLAEKHPEGIKQRKEHMQDDLAREKVQTVKIVEKLCELEKKIQDSIKLDELAVERSVEAIMSKAQELIGQIREKSQPKLTHIRQQLTQLQAQIKSIEATQSTLKTMPDGEFITQTDTLATQIEKLQIDENELVQINGDHRICKFVANAQLGKIIMSRELELVEEFGDFEGAAGIATLLTGSLVVSDQKKGFKEVAVFENKNGQFEKTLEINGIHADINCLDIALTPDDKILVANETAGIGIYSSNDGKHQEQITHKSDSKIQERTISITTTTDGRILAGSGVKDGDREYSRCKVTVYDAARNIIKTIPTSVLPNCLADIRGTMVAMSDVTTNKVCVYDLQSGKQTLNFDIDLPAGIIYDEQSDCLLIARIMEKDKFGKRVLRSCVIEQYCSTTGTLVACLAQGLYQSWAMTFTRDGRLAVADYKTVKLYHMS